MLGKMRGGLRRNLYSHSAKHLKNKKKEIKDVDKWLLLLFLYDMPSSPNM